MTLSMRSLGYVLLALLWTATVTVAQQPLPQAPHMGTIMGTVLDVNGGIVPGAAVVLQGADSSDRRVLVTDDAGLFRFDGIRPGGSHRIQVSASGLKSWNSNEIVLKPGQEFIVTGIVLAVAPVETTVDAVTLEEIAVQQVKQEEKQRIGGIIPNFYVSYDHNAVPLTPRLKFQLALKALTDPVTIAGFGLGAGIYQAADYPSYELGAKGYAKRLGATFAGGYTKIMVGDAILPSLLHQDPRYFYQGTGTTGSRLRHALSSAFITKGDDGSREINWSNLGGDLVSGALTNAYYPSKDRGASLVVRSALIGTGGRMALAVFQEFVGHKLTTHVGDGN